MASINDGDLSKQVHPTIELTGNKVREVDYAHRHAGLHSHTYVCHTHDLSDRK